MLFPLISIISLSCNRSVKHVVKVLTVSLTSDLTRWKEMKFGRQLIFFIFARRQGLMMSTTVSDKHSSTRFFLISKKYMMVSSLFLWHLYWGDYSTRSPSIESASLRSVSLYASYFISLSFRFSSSSSASKAQIIRICDS